MPPPCLVFWEERHVSLYWQFLRRNQVFTVLWIGESISILGSSLLFASWGYWFYSMAESPLLISIYALIVMLVRAAAAPFAGIWADRFDRRRLLVWSNAIRALMTLVPLFIRDPSDIWIAFVSAAVGAAAQSVFRTAWGALVPTLVPESELMRANALTSIATQVAMIVGPAAGGLLYGLWGAVPTFVGDSMSYVIGAAAVLVTFRRVPGRLPTPRQTQRNGWGRRLWSMWSMPTWSPLAGC